MKHVPLLAFALFVPACSGKPGLSEIERDEIVGMIIEYDDDRYEVEDLRKRVEELKRRLHDDASCQDDPLRWSNDR